MYFFIYIKKKANKENSCWLLDLLNFFSITVNEVQITSKSDYFKNLFTLDFQLKMGVLFRILHRTSENHHLEFVSLIQQRNFVQ